MKYHSSAAGNTFSATVVVLAALALAACGAMRQSSEPAYQRARQAQALEVPPDLSRPESGGVPDIVAAEATAEELSEFERFRMLEQMDEYEEYRRWKAQASVDEKLDYETFLAARRAARESGGDDGGVTTRNNIEGARDILVKADAAATWSYVDEALVALNVEVLERNADDYRFEVSLPEVRESSLLRPSGSRFTVQLERAGDEMVVALLDRGGARVTLAAAAEFMSRLAGQIRTGKMRSQLQGPVSAATGTPAGTMRATESGHYVLDLPYPPLRAFDQLDYVVDQIGFTVLERNRDELRFALRYVTDDQIPKERTGLAKLAFWANEPAPPEGFDRYTIVVSEAPGGSTVSVVDVNGEPGEIPDTILELLREKL